jgi:hypothetical protein
MFCLNYYPSQSYLKDADEFKIKYRPADRTLEDFLKTYQDKSIVIDVTNNFEEVDAQLFESLYNKYKNFKLIIDYNNEEYLNRVKAYELPFFFSNYVTTIDQLNGLLAYHPTDMYICEELGFNLHKVSKLLHDNNVRVRVFPNICQSSFHETPSLKTFFIRPEDIPNYSAFVDVFELVSDEKRQEVLFKIYKQEKWFGKISEIIPTFKGDLDSRYIIANFGTIRSRCGKRCMYNPKTCSVCDRYVEMAKTLENHKIIVRKAKKM